MKRRLNLIISLGLIILGAILTKALQHKFSLPIFALLMIALVGLAVQIIRRLLRRGISPKYERRPRSPWSALSDGIDPTI
ncbi:MAG: hypothetical protein WCK62_01640 [Actinomycetes bacterium]|jgi:uncharacterized membrane protein